jgi:uncharacterized OsmC-like protein
MRIILEGETRIRVLPTGPGLEVETAEDAGPVDFSPLHMLAASLATCTASVLLSWAMQTRLAFEDLELDLSWEYVDNPYRVGRYDLTLVWPSLPEDRHEAAIRAARHCTVEHTLSVPPEIGVGVGG